MSNMPCIQAITIFRSAIKKVPEHIVAQCGLASALLGRARECASIGACAWAATLLVVCILGCAI